MTEEELELNDINETEESEWFEHYKLVVDKGQGLLRIDKFLVLRIQNASRTKVQQAAESGNILVNKQAVKSNYKVKPGDEISIVFPHPPRVIELRPENIPLDIVYEDDELIVINKPAGLVVHPGYGNYTGTLVNALIYHFENLPQPANQAEARPGLVHRIDKDTSGLLVVAKTEYALNSLARQFYERTTNRKYIALVWGDFDEPSGTITGNLARSVKDRKIMAVYDDPEIGKHAVTHYKLLERMGYVSVVECKLETGRTHQIRVHFQHIGHPLFNDPTYGGNKVVKGTLFSKYKQFVENCFDICPRQALHAFSLGFIHPKTGKELYFEAPLPDDMKQVMEKWRNYSINKGLTNEE
jgi:23S rRNA pseudouridine1911/1915/1917 synthase